MANTLPLIMSVRCSRLLIMAELATGAEGTDSWNSFLSICGRYCEWSLPTLSGEGVHTVPFARTTLKQASACCVKGPSVWNDLSLELRLLSRTLSDTFNRRLKRFFLTVLSQERL